MKDGGKSVRASEFPMTITVLSAYFAEVAVDRQDRREPRLMTFESQTNQNIEVTRPMIMRVGGSLFVSV